MIPHFSPTFLVCSTLSLCLTLAHAGDDSSILVTNLDDSGEGSLRAAIRDANDSGHPDVIEFSESASSGVVRLQSPLPPIFSKITINGPGADQVTVSGDSDEDGSPDTSIFSVVGPSANAKISGLTLAEGLAGRFRFDGPDDEWEIEEGNDGGKGKEWDKEDDNDDPWGKWDFHHHSGNHGAAVAVAFGARCELFKVAVVDCVAGRDHLVEIAAGFEDDDEKEDDEEEETTTRHGDTDILNGFPRGAAISVLFADIHLDSCLVANNRIGGERIDEPEIEAGEEGGKDDDDKDDEDRTTRRDSSRPTVGAGAAIYLAGSPLNEATIKNSTISGNDANNHSNGNAHSGAIYVTQSSVGSEFEGWDDEDLEHGEDFWFDPEEVGKSKGKEEEKKTTRPGGDERPRYTVLLLNNTVAENVTERGCAGIVIKNHKPLVLLQNNIFALNSVERDKELCNFRQRGGHPHSAAVSLGGNVFDDGSGEHFLTETNDLNENKAIQLGALADNGGPTATHALGEGSSAIGNAAEGAPDLDQRCFARDDAPDSGAYESTDVVPVNTPPFVTVAISDVSVDFGNPDLTFSVHPNFGDAEDSDSELVFEVTVNTDTGVVTTSVIASADGELTLSFVGLGVSEIEITTTDTGGLSAATGFTVTVGDSVKPVISGMPDDISVPNDPGEESAVVGWTAPTASDNVGVTSFTSSHSPGDTFPLGTTTVTYTASDAAGNVCTDSFTVTVGDTEKPEISGMPADITAPTDPGEATAVVTWAEPSASDNVAVVSFVSTHSSGDAFPVGVTAVSYTATDAAGNECTDGFTVTVVDEEKPTVSGLPADILIEAELGSDTAVVEWAEPEASDNVGVASFTSNFSSGDEFPIGETIVTYTATDAAGNSCLASFLVTVEEAEGGFFLDFISVRTDPAPGTAGANFFSYQHAFINETDMVAFEGTVSGGDTTTTNNSGIWFGDINGVDVIAREEDPAAGLAPDLEYGLFTGLNVSDADEVSFNNQMRGPVTTITDVGHFSEIGAGAVTNRVREGDAAPGTPGIFKIIQPPVAGTGMTATPAHLNIAAPIGGTSDTGIWSTHGGPLGMVAWESSGVSAIPGASYGQISSIINMNESGALAFQCFVAGNGGGNSIVLSGQPGALGVSFEKSTGAPGTGGANYLNFLTTAISGSGNVAVRASLFNSVALGVTSANNEGIWANIGGTVSLAAREGDQVPDLPAGVTFKNFKELVIADDGSVCFSGFVSGAGVTSANDGCLWSNASGTLRTLAREGEVAPGTDGAIFRMITRFACNNNATIGFVADLVTNIGDAAPGSNQGLWLSNPETAELDLALRTGTSFTFAPGDQRVITLIRMDKSTNVSGGGGGSGRVLNDQDHLALILEFQLGSGVFVAGRVTP